MTRKEKLIERAARFSDRMQRKSNITTPQPDTWDNAHDGFLGGYRAAMSDMRSVVADALHQRGGSRVAVDGAMTEFLKPLR